MKLYQGPSKAAGQLLFEELHDVEGGHTRAGMLRLLGERSDKALVKGHFAQHMMVRTTKHLHMEEHYDRSGR